MPELQADVQILVVPRELDIVSVAGKLDFSGAGRPLDFPERLPPPLRDLELGPPQGVAERVDQLARRYDGFVVSLSLDLRPEARSLVQNDALVCFDGPDRHPEEGAGAFLDGGAGHRSR